MKIFESQLIKFMIVGTLATMVDVSIFMMAARHLSYDYRALAFFSWTLGFMVNFFLCDFFVFQSYASPRWRAALNYYFTSLGSFGLQMAGMFLLIHYSFVQSWLIARISVASIVFLFNFLIIRRFVFPNQA